MRLMVPSHAAYLNLFSVPLPLFVYTYHLVYDLDLLFITLTTPHFPIDNEKNIVNLKKCGLKIKIFVFQRKNPNKLKSKLVIL